MEKISLISPSKSIETGEEPNSILAIEIIDTHLPQMRNGNVGEDVCWRL